MKNISSGFISFPSSLRFAGTSRRDKPPDEKSRKQKAEGKNENGNMRFGWPHARISQCTMKSVFVKRSIKNIASPDENEK
jgi:hypothetical protein